MQEPCPFRPHGHAVLTCGTAWAFVAPLAGSPRPLASGPLPQAGRCACRARGSYARRIPSWVLEPSRRPPGSSPAVLRTRWIATPAQGLGGLSQAGAWGNLVGFEDGEEKQGAQFGQGAAKSATPPKRNMFAWRRWVKRWAPKIPQPTKPYAKARQRLNDNASGSIIKSGPRECRPKSAGAKSRVQMRKLGSRVSSLEAH